MSSKVVSLAAMLPAAMLASAEIVSVPLSTQEGAVGKSKAAGSYYSIPLVVGTPGETVPVKFDTGSSELWVNPECDNSSNPAVCAAQGRFTESTTIDVLEGETASLDGAQVQYATDYVRIGSATITQQIFGLGQSSKDSVVGVFGAGPQASGFDSEYPTAIDSLAAQEFIASRAFSLDLKGQGSEKGSVVFGGVDTQKYAGHLTKLAVVPGPNGESGWFVKLDQISITKPDGTVTTVYSGPGQTVLLDSGSSLSTLPPAIFASLLEAFPSAKLDDATGLHSVDCTPSAGSIDFTFGDKVISVPVSDFVVNVPGSNLCVLGAFEGNSAVLGDTFLKSAYAVFDFDNQAVHLAQAADCGSNLVAIGSGPDAVPSVEGCGALARRLAKLIEPETTPEDEPEWCDEDGDDEDEEEDEDEWCEDEDNLPTGHPTNTRGPTGQPTGGHSSQPTGGHGGHGPTGSSSGSGGQPTGGHGGHGGHSSQPTGGQSSQPTGGHGGQPTGGHGSQPTGTHGGHSSQPTGGHGGQPTGGHGSQPTGGHGGHSGHGSGNGPRPTGSAHGPITRETLTRTQYSTFTVTSCAPTVTNCPAGHVVTQVITRTTEVCPESTAVYTRHQPGGGQGHPFTIKPVQPRPTPIAVPGCSIGLDIGLGGRPGGPRPSGGQSHGAPGGGAGSWTPGSGAPGHGAPGSGAPGHGAPGSGSCVGAGCGHGSGAPGSGAPGHGAPGGGAPGSGSGSWTPGSGSGAPGSGAHGSGSGSWSPEGGAAGSCSGAGCGHGAGAPGSGAPGSGSGSWAPGAGAPGSGSPEGGAPGSGACTGAGCGHGAGAPGSGSPASGAPGAGAPGAGACTGAGCGHGAGAGSPTTLVAHPTGSFHAPAGGNGTTSGLKPVVTAGASRMSWTAAALVGAFVAGVMAL